MSRKRGGVEIRVTAGLLGVALLGACVAQPAGVAASHPWDNGPWSAERPAGLQYKEAVRCAGVLGALLAADKGGTLSPELPPLQDLYARWAYLIAFNDGGEAGRAVADSEAGKAEALAAVSALPERDRLAALQDAHGAEVEGCMAVERVSPPEPPMVVT